MGAGYWYERDVRAMRGRKIRLLICALMLAAVCPDGAWSAEAPVEERRVADEGDVVSLYVDAEGGIYWNGERIDTNTLALRLSLLDRDDAIALYGSVEESQLRRADRSVMETVLRTGVPLVLVEDESRLRLPMQAENGQARPVTLSTVRIRQALDLYDRTVGRQDRSRPLSGTDVVLRFDPSEEQGYLLRRIELGLGGRALWIVHESLNERESSTSIQLKREW